MKLRCGVQCLVVLGLVLGAAVAEVLVDVEVDLRTPSSFKPFAHYWKRSFGSGHASLSLRPDWQAHLKQAVDDLGVGGVRFHGIFDDDMGVVPNTAAMQSQKYNFTLIDKTWDYQVSLGVAPLVELSFMPCVLANCSWHGVNPTAPACKSMEFHYQGVKQQPTSFEDWYNLVKGLVQHAVDRYGKEEVKKWDFEVWNEGRWMGMPFPQPYLTLFNASSRAVKSVDSSFRIGGPASANLAHVKDFVQAATQLDIPFDFVSTHHYPTDSCRPTAVGNKSVWDPDCFMKGVKASRDTVPNTTFYLTETNVGCCLGYSQHDTSAAAAFAFKTVGGLDGITDLMSWWTFSDVFEEGGFPTSEFTNIYGLMTVHGIPKPGWRGFQLLNEAGDTRVPVRVTETHGTQYEAPTNDRVQRSTIAQAGILSGNSCLQGGMGGGDIHNATLTINAASNWCLQNIKCAGFTTTGQYPTACSASSATFDMHFKDTWGAQHRDSDPMLTSWLSGISPTPPPTPAPPTPTDVPLITAFATTSSASTPTSESSHLSSADPLSTLRVYVAFWSVVATGIAPPANRTVTVSVTTSVPHDQLYALTSASTATIWRIDEGHANPLAAWQAMGSPPSPNTTQLASLIATSAMHPEQVAVAVSEVQRGGKEDGGVANAEVKVVLQMHMTPNAAVMVTF